MRTLVGLAMCALMGLGTAGAAEALDPQPLFQATHTVLVWASPGDPVASGARLRSALAGINPASCPGDFCVTLRGSGPAGRGLLAFSIGTATVDRSTVHGDQAAVEASSPAQVRVGASRLSGGAVFGNVTCAGVYDESYAFFPSTCP